MSGDFHSMTRPRARKRHQCQECFGEIAIGEQHVHSTGKLDGDMYDTRYCEGCYDLWTAVGEAFDWYGENSPHLGDLRSEMRDDYGITDPDAWLANWRAGQLARKARP